MQWVSQLCAVELKKKNINVSCLPLDEWSEHSSTGLSAHATPLVNHPNLSLLVYCMNKTWITVYCMNKASVWENINICGQLSGRFYILFIAR